MDIAKLRVGQKVCYQPEHYENDQWENGIVKEVPDHTTVAVRVVYNCGGDWEKYQDYTSALTNLHDLHDGWKH